jgi:tetratricopeptide (TPR) repeat protein/anti-sigma regulatory factor (Ser/Thr protein kinase)
MNYFSTSRTNSITMKFAFKKHFCLYTALIFISFATAQDKCKCAEADALRPKIGGYFNSGKLDSAALILEQLKDSKNETCNIVYLDGIGQVYVAKKQFAQARGFFSTEEVLQKKLNCKKLLVRFYNTLARYYQETGYRDSVSYITLKAIELAEEEKDWYAASRASINLASIFQQEKQFDKYLFYSRKALPFARFSKDSVILAAVLTRNAESYFIHFEQTKQKAYLDSSYALAKECISISRNIPANLLEFSDAYSRLSQYYFANTDYNKALVYADSAILVCPNGVFDFYRHLLNGYSAKGKAYFAMNNFKDARTVADSAYRYAMLFNKQTAIQPLEIIFETSKKLKDFERSSAAHEEMVQLRDSIFTIEKTSAINELEKKYNQAKNEKTIKELSLQKQIYLLLAIAALLGIGAIGFFLRQQSLKHKQKILETEQRLNRSRMNPHFFFNALASLQSFALEKNDGRAIAGNLSKFSGLMRETLESTYNDYVTIEQETDFLKQYLDLQLLRFPEKFTYTIEADDELEQDELLVPSMIVQTFVENSIEHGFSGIDYKGIINVHFSKKAKELHIAITDNGKGFSKEKNKSSNHISRAGQIVKDRIYLLNLKLKSKAGFSIEEGKDNGVVVKIVLPEMYKS